MVSIYPINLFDYNKMCAGSIYIPSRLIPNEKTINNFDNNLDRKDFIYYDKDGVLGVKRDNLKLVFSSKEKMSKRQIIPLITNNIDTIISYMKQERHQQKDIKYFIELIESNDYSYKRLAIYMLLNGEFNTDKLGFGNLKLK